MSEEQHPTPWRTIISVLVFILIVVRFAVKIFTPSSNQPETNLSLMSPGLQQIQDRQQIASDHALTKASNKIMYSSYADLDTFSVEQLHRYKLVKLQKDSMVVFDLNSKIKVNKGYYYQNNHDKLMRMAIKAKNGMTVFIHDFKTSGHIETRLERIKAEMEFSDYKQESFDKLRLASYRINKDGTKYNGFAVVFQDTNYSMFIEFESDKLNPSKLRKEALSFFTKNLITEK